MENYKEINRELIDANREMRLHISSYQKEVVQLRAELMEQRRLRVEFERDYRARLVSVLTRNFREALEEFDPSSSVLDVLGGETPDNATKQYSTTDCRSDTTTGRRSSLILSEFRRSSAMHRRHSSVPASPTKRHSAEVVTPLCSSLKENSNASTTEKDETLEAVDNSEQNDENYEPQTHLQIINEVNEGDLSGNSKTGKQSNQHTNLSHKPHSNDSCTGTKEGLCGPAQIERVVVRRGKQWNRTPEHKDESIEEARLVSRTANDTTLTPAKFPSYSDECQPEDNTSRSPSMVLSELMMENFIDAPSSTPCSIVEVCGDSLKRQCLRSHTDEISNATLALTGSHDQTNSGRPSRRCAPRCLVEPSLGRKLRNESATNKKKKGKKK